MKKNLIYILTIIVLTIGWSNTIAQTNNREKSYLGSWVGNQKSFKALYKLKINDIFIKLHIYIIQFNGICIELLNFAYLYL
jgi:hypothetical protein